MEIIEGRVEHRDVVTRYRLHHEQVDDPLLHHDLKPDNVLITADLVAKRTFIGRHFDTKEARSLRTSSP